MSTESVNLGSSLVSQQQSIVINKDQPQLPDQSVKITKKFEKLGKLILDSNDESKTIALLFTTDYLLPKLITGDSKMNPVTALFTQNYFSLSPEKKLEVLAQLNQCVEFQAIKQYLLHSTPSQSKEARIKITFSNCVLTDFASDLEEGNILLDQFKTDVQKEINHIKTLGTEEGKEMVGPTVLSLSVTTYYETYMKLHNTAIDYLDSIRSKKERSTVIKDPINANINEFKKLNEKNIAELEYIFNKIGANVVGAYENIKQGAENWLPWNHSLVVASPEKGKLSNLDAILVNESNFYQLLSENLAFYEKVKHFIKDAKKFGEKVLWLQTNYADNPNKVQSEEKAKKLRETYENLNEGRSEIYQKLEEYNQKLTSIQAFVDLYLGEKLAGLAEHEKTITKQTNSLLKEVHDLSMEVNKKHTYELEPITSDTREKHSV